MRRVGHAMTRTLFTRDGQGRAVPNVPLVAGAAGGALIARAWYPRDERPGGDAARIAAMSLVGQAGVNVAKEFAPELKRLIPFRKPRPRNEPIRRDLASASAPASASAADTARAPAPAPAH
jgi:hypothetical protein